MTLEELKKIRTILSAATGLEDEDQEIIGAALKAIDALIKPHTTKPAAPVQPVAWPEHEFIQWGAKKYGPLVQAAINLLAEIDSNHDSKSYPQKYGVPYGAVNTLRDALTATPPAPVPLTADQREGIAKGWRGRNWSVGDIIDAVEAAHKITTTPKKGNT